MDTRTGEILTLDDFKKKLDPKELTKYVKPIPKEYVELMDGMNRKERRRFYKLHKKEFEREAE